MFVRLDTYTGTVGRVEIPRFEKLPEVLVWGTRTFVLEPGAAAGYGDLAVRAVYREGCAFHVVGDLIREEKDGKRD